MSASLPTRKIGSSNVTAIGFGAMGLSAYYGKTKSDEERLAFLDALYSSNCKNWDSADIYGDSEDLIGRWFKNNSEKRNDIFLATKFAITHDPKRPVNGDPEYVKQACEKSLKRLGVDYIDLYYMHRPDPKVPIERTVGAMAELVKKGKVKYIGLSEVNASTIRRAHAVHPIAAIQLEYSPFCLEAAREDVRVIQTCRELGIAVVAYSPLGRGLLTGKFKGPEDFEEGDFRLTVPMYSKENFPKILEISRTMEEIGAKYSASAGSVCLAWVLAQGEDIIPIPGTTRVENLKENLAALSINLSAQDVQRIDAAVKEAGIDDTTRYGEAQRAAILVDTPPLSE